MGVTSLCQARQNSALYHQHLLTLAQAEGRCWPTQGSQLMGAVGRHRTDQAQRSQPSPGVPAQGRSCGYRSHSGKQLARVTWGSPGAGSWPDQERVRGLVLTPSNASARQDSTKKQWGFHLVKNYFVPLKTSSEYEYI